MRCTNNIKPRDMKLNSVIEALGIDTDVIDAKNEAIDKRLYHLDEETKRDHLVPVPRRTTFRDCPTCLHTVQKQAENHYLVRDMKDFAEKLYRNILDCRDENYCLGYELRGRKEIMRNVLHMSPEKIEAILKASRDGQTDIPELGDGGSVKDADTRDKKPKKKTDDAMETGPQRSGAGRPRRRADKKQTDVKMAEEIDEVERAIKIACKKARKELKSAIATNKKLKKQKRELLESVDLAKQQMLKEDEIIEELDKTKTSTNKKLSKVRKDNHCEVTSLRDRLEIADKGHNQNLSICEKLESLIDLRMKVMDRVEEQMKNQIAPDGTELAEGEGEEEEGDSGDEEKGDEPVPDDDEDDENEDTEVRWDMSTLILHRDKIKGLCEEACSENGVLATKISRLGKSLDEKIEQILNLQHLQRKCILKTKCLEKEAESAEVALRGIEWSKKLKEKSPAEGIQPYYARLNLLKAHLSAMYGENEMLNSVAAVSTQKTLQDFTLFTLLMKKMTDDFKHSVQNFVNIYQEPLEPDEEEEGVEDENSGSEGDTDEEDDDDESEGDDV